MTLEKDDLAKFFADEEVQCLMLQQILKHRVPFLQQILQSHLFDVTILQNAEYRFYIDVDEAVKQGCGRGIQFYIAFASSSS